MLAQQANNPPVGLIIKAMTRSSEDNLYLYHKIQITHKTRDNRGRLCVQGRAAVTNGRTEIE